MANFNATDAALRGFRFVREQPRTAAIWAGLTLVVQLISGLLMTVMAGPQMMRLRELQAEKPPNTSEVLSLMVQCLPFYGVAIVLGLVIYSIQLGAANRAVLQPSQSRAAYLRLSGDELRQALLLLLIVLVAIGIEIACVVIVLILTVAAKQAAPWAPVVLLALICAAAIYVWTRLSLASPLSYGERRVDLFGSWDLTRGRFWKMFGTYLLVLALTILVGLLIMVIAVVAGMLFGGGLQGAQSVFRPDTSSLAAYFSPAQLIVLVIWSLGSGFLVGPLVLMPAAEIYRQITADQPKV